MGQFIIPGVLLFLFSTFNLAAQWVQSSNGMGLLTVYAIATNDNKIFAAASGHPSPRSIFLSTDNGMYWAQTSLNQLVYSIAISANFVFAGSQDNGVYRSTNNGTDWTQTSLNNRTVRSLASNGSITLAGIIPGFEPGMYKSTDLGITWVQSGLLYSSVNSLAINGNYIIAGTSSGVYLSTNNGTNWTQTSLNNRSIYALALNGNNMIAGAGDGYGVYLSTNNGTNWTQTSLNDQTVRSLTVNGNDIFAGTPGNGIYVSNNNGTSWSSRNEGLGNLYIFSLCILNNYVFAGTDGAVYRRPLSELTGIVTIANELPNKFSLSQNYPNPFNPKSRIKFQISKLSEAKLIIYDILGREVTTLVSKQLSPGKYEVEWNATAFPSCVYYYRLIAGDYSDTKKMVLIK